VVQYIQKKDGAVKGMITFELSGRYKKWPQMDINYMKLLGRLIFEKLFEDGDT